MMIERTKVNFNTAIWRIEKMEISLCHRVNILEQETLSHIEAYRDSLRDASYEHDNTTLCAAFNFLTSIPFITIGYCAYHEDFLKMFRYYTKKFLIEWDECGKRLDSLVIGIPYVFQSMLGYSLLSNNCSVRCTDSRVKICYKDDLNSILEEESKMFWQSKIKMLMKQNQSLLPVTSRIGKSRATNYCIEMLDFSAAYMARMAAAYTANRDMISKRKFQIDVLGYKFRAAECDKAFNDKLEQIVADEVLIQQQKFISENHLQLDIQSDLWVLYKMHGPAMHRCNLDFTIIKSPSFRLEVKHYMRHRLLWATRIEDGYIFRIASAVNLLTARNPNIKYFADIDDVDAKGLHMTLEDEQKNRSLAMSVIVSSFSACRVVCAFLMGDMRGEEIMSPRPHHNPFAKYSFVNAIEYSQNTPVIPEEVMEQLEAYCHELQSTDQLILKNFCNTGMRFKEVQFLEADCLEKSKYKGFMTLKYKPYKVLSARRRAHISDYHRILIPSTLASEIRRQISDTESLRIEYGLPYIFIRKIGNIKARMFGLSRFVKRINKIVEKHGICGEDGSLWHFTSRQYRKTLAVTLIENGASVEELAYWLGHLDRATTVRYYAEVRKKKLAEMNTQFFKMKFDLLLSQEQLEEYSEEERRLLYVDFCLEQRKVEFGYCLKKAADGGCDRRNSLYNCVNCKNLCTGKRYLPYWQGLLSDQEAIVENLLQTYAENNIKQYGEFKEYRQEQFLLECYQNIVRVIMEAEK